MHDVVIELKDGRKLIGPIWTWHPKEGYLELDIDHWSEGKVYFRDIKTAVQCDVMVNITSIEDIDLLVRAKNEGWDGT